MAKCCVCFDRIRKSDEDDAVRCEKCNCLMHENCVNEHEDRYGEDRYYCDDCLAVKEDEEENGVYDW
jgi:late competence protein required for DNA uptake (superfamily II DNA/RNA helicase)